MHSLVPSHPTLAPLPCSRHRLAAISLIWLAISGGNAAVAGIPEPDLIWYGRVQTVLGGKPVRLTTGTLIWKIEPPAGGAPWELTTELANINDQFSFVLRVACESPEPGGEPTAGTVVLTSPATSYRRLTVTLDGEPLTLSVAPAMFSPLRADRGREERIDLVLGELPSDSDSDGDGMTDAWELQYFGLDGADPDADADDDGVSNLNEYRAGTHPMDARSVFEVVEIAPLPEGIRILWSSQPNRNYRIRRATSLLADPAGYAVVQSGITATPPINEFLDTTTGGSSRFFYLIEVVE